MLLGERIDGGRALPAGRYGEPLLLQGAANCRTELRVTLSQPSPRRLRRLASAFTLQVSRLPRQLLFSNSAHLKTGVSLQKPLNAYYFISGEEQRKSVVGQFQIFRVAGELARRLARKRAGYTGIH